VRTSSWTINATSPRGDSDCLVWMSKAPVGCDEAPSADLVPSETMDSSILDSMDGEV